MKTPYFLLILILFISCDERLSSKKTVDLDTIDVEEQELPWSESLENPSQGYAHLPRLKSQDGKLHMTWVEQEDSLAVLKYSVYEEPTWSPVEVVASGKDWFVNWADFPAVAVNNGTVMATFLQKSAKGTYDYDVKYTLKNKVSGQWSSSQTLHNDNIAAEHGFVSLLSYQEGFFATWLDGRNTDSSGGGHDSSGHGGMGAMTLRSALIDVQGKITKRNELDNRICDCCSTSAVQTDEGLVIVYRDRSEGDAETRDIYRAIWQEESTIVPAPVYNDNWKINGCPVNGPAIDAIDNTAVAAWFTAAGDSPQVLVAFSQDGGLNFDKAIPISEGEAIGRVDVVMLEDGSAAVLYIDHNFWEGITHADAVNLWLKRVYQDGTTGVAKKVNSISAERMSGFPQIETSNGILYVAWTDTQDKSASIEVMRIEPTL